MPENFTLRTATDADADAVRALTCAAYAKWVPVIGREPLPMTADYDAALLQHEIELACLGQVVVGLVETEMRDDHLWVENLAVWPGHQGLGLGRQLLARAEGRARAAGRAEMRLQTNEAFAANIAMYTRFGYYVAAREPFRGGFTLHLRKPLGG